MNSRQTTAGFMARKGAGYYSKATRGAKHVLDHAAGLVLDAIGRAEGIEVSEEKLEERLTQVERALNLRDR